MIISAPIELVSLCFITVHIHQAELSMVALPLRVVAARVLVVLRDAWTETMTLSQTISESRDFISKIAVHER